MRVPPSANTATLNKALDVLFVLVVAFIVSLKLQEFFNVNVVLLGAALVYLFRDALLERDPAAARVRLNEMDYAVLVVALVELVGYAASTYRENSFYPLMEVLFLLLFYCLVRLNLRHDYQRLALYVFITLWGVFLAAVAVYWFLPLDLRIRALGFSDFTDFRNYIYVLNPVGVSIGEWVSVLFLMLPFPVAFCVGLRRPRAARWLALAAMVAVVCTIAVTFIRGAYMGLAAFFLFASALFYVYGLLPLKRILLFNALVVCLTAVCLLPLARPVTTTLAVLKTTSQVRSLEGRKNIWRDSLEIIKRHPVFGVGSQNFVMQYAGYREQRPDAAFAQRPFNYFFQILVEKGLLGLVAYGLLLVCFYRVSHRKIRLLGDDTFRKSVVICLMAAYAALIVRDFSDSSILTNRGVAVLLWFAFAHNAGLEGEASRPAAAPHTRNVWPYLPALLALLLLAGAHFKYARLQAAEESFYAFTQQAGRGDLDAARVSIDAALAASPDNAHYLSNAALLHERTLRRPFDFASFASPAPDADERRHVEAGIELFRRVLELNPFDDHACHNLGWLYWLAGRRAEALEYLSRANELDSDFPLYRVSLGLVREYGGDPSAADEEYARALRSSPSVADSPFFAELRGRSPKRAERLIAGAVAYFEEQVRRGGGAMAKAKLGKLYLESQPERATHLLEEAATDLPSLSRPWANLGYLYEQRGDAAQAERSYRKALFIEQDVPTIIRLGSLQEKQQRTQEAINQYRWAVNTWRNQSSIHASRVRRIYQSRYTLRDDVAPRGISVYASPAFDMVGMCRKLSAMLRQVGNENAAAFYEKLAAEYAP